MILCCILNVLVNNVMHPHLVLDLKGSWRDSCFALSWFYSTVEWLIVQQRGWLKVSVGYRNVWMSNMRQLWIGKSWLPQYSFSTYAVAQTLRGVNSKPGLLCEKVDPLWIWWHKCFSEILCSKSWLYCREGPMTLHFLFQDWIMLWLGWLHWLQ